MFYLNHTKINHLASFGDKNICLFKLHHNKAVHSFLVLLALFYSSFVFAQKEQNSFIYVCPQTVISNISSIHVASNEDSLKKKSENKEDQVIFISPETFFYNSESVQYNVVYLEEKREPTIISQKDNLSSSENKPLQQEVVSSKHETQLTSSPLPILPYKTKHVITLGLTSSVVSSSNSNIAKKSKENSVTLAELLTIESANISKGKVKLFCNYKKSKAYTIAIRYSNRPPPVLFS